MMKDDPSGVGGGPPSPRTTQQTKGRGPYQHSGGSRANSSSFNPSTSSFHKDHRWEREMLRAELEAERMRSKEAQRRFAIEARELREAAKRDRQLLADQLRSKWEQRRARELHQLKETTQRQREAEIRQLLRWKEAELQEAQKLLQRERDSAMRQARDWQSQMAKVLVSYGVGSRGAGGGGSDRGLRAERCAELQEVLSKRQREVDSDQVARIRYLQAELELERNLFLKYILQRFDGESLLSGSSLHRFRQASLPQHLGRARSHSLETHMSDVIPDVSLVNHLSRCESPHHHHLLLEQGSSATSSCAERPCKQASGKGLHVEKKPVKKVFVDSPPEGEVNSWGAAGEHGQEGLPRQGWLPGDCCNQQNADLLKSLKVLEQRYTHLQEENAHLQEENALLRKSSFPEMQDKAKLLKRKSAELVVIAKRLEEAAKKLQESSLRVHNAPVPLALNCSDMELGKKATAQQQGKDLNEKTLEKECQELQVNLSSRKENNSWLNICDSDRLLRESQREVLRLQRQLALRTQRASLQASKIASIGSSSSVLRQEASSAIKACVEDALAKEKPKTLNVSKEDKESQALPFGNEAKNDKNRCEVEEKQKRCDEVELKLRVFLAQYSYDPFNGPNENPEAELPLTAGEYVFVCGEMDEDGFYVGELMDGKRGFVPSNLVEEVAGNELCGFIPSEPRDISYHSFHESGFSCQRASSQEKNNSPDEEKCVRLPSDRPEQTFGEVRMPDPQNLTLILNLRNISATSAEITWFPSNSNYPYVVYLNEEKYDVIKGGVCCYTFPNLRPSTQYSVNVEPLVPTEALVYPQGEQKQRATEMTFTTPSAGPPDAPLDVQVQAGSSADILVISWLPVTIHPSGSSNGVKVTGYAVYICGQKVTEIMSPTAGSVSLEVSRINMFQEPRTVSVRTVSPFGESADSVPALIPPNLPKVRYTFLSKFN